MRFVAVKSEETQGAAMVFRIRELLIRQRTQAIKALRGHLIEFGRPLGHAGLCALLRGRHNTCRVLICPPLIRFLEGRRCP